MSHSTDCPYSNIAISIFQREPDRNSGLFFDVGELTVTTCIYVHKRLRTLIRYPHMTQPKEIFFSPTTPFPFRSFSILKSTRDHGIQKKSSKHPIFLNFISPVADSWTPALRMADKEMSDSTGSVRPPFTVPILSNPIFSTSASPRNQILSW